MMVCNSKYFSILQKKPQHFIIHVRGWPVSQIQQAITICKQIVFTFCNASYLNSHFWWHRSHQMHDSSTLLLKDATALLSYRYGNNNSVFSLAFFCSSQFFNNYTAVPENSTFYSILSTGAKKKPMGEINCSSLWISFNRLLESTLLSFSKTIRINNRFDDLYGLMVDNFWWLFWWVVFQIERIV